MKLVIQTRNFLTLGLCFLSISLAQATTPLIFPTGSVTCGMIDVTQSPYTADPTGVNDSTATIQQAIKDNIGFSPTRTLYFPTGTYTISSTLNCENTSNQTENRMSFQGAGQGLTVLKLTNNNTAFQSLTAPASVIHLNQYGNGSGAPNNGQENNVWNMTIDVGSGNPGAIGIDWNCNNLATIRDVTIQSDDPAHAGYCGLYCDGYPGPALGKNLIINGFVYGIYVRSNQPGMTFDNITLSNQTTSGTFTGYGIYNNGNGVFMRHITSTDAVSTIYAGTSGVTTMTTSTLTGTSSSVPAIAAQATNTPIYLRDITESGYGSLVAKGSTVMQLAQIPTGEYCSQQVTRLFNNAEAGLMLDPTTDAPEYYDANLAHWASVITYGADSTGAQDCTSAVQQAINSGATTVYFPTGTYTIGGTVNVNNNVVRIFGNQSVIQTSGTGTSTAANPMPIFNVQSGTSSYVIFDRLHCVSNADGTGGIYNVINQASTRQIVLRDSSLGNFGNTTTGGSLYMENLEGIAGTFNQMTVYGWQVDSELFFPKFVNNNSKLWLLGLKTEVASTAVTTINGGKTEVLGGFIFSNSATWNTPMFINNNSQFFGSFEEFNSGSSAGWYADVVRETEGTVTRDLHSWDTPTPLSEIAAYSDNSATPVHAVPTATITIPTDGSVYAFGSNVSVTMSATAQVGSLSTYSLNAFKPFQAQSTTNILTSNTSTYTWSAPAPGNYTLYVKATDSGNVIGYSNPVHIIVKPNLTAAVGATAEYWEDNEQQWIPDSLTGYVSQLQILPNFINDKPDTVNYPATNLATTSPSRNCGIRLHGYIQPPGTGTYTFSISSSAYAALWMTTDSANPGNVGEKQLIAVNDAPSAVGVWTTANTSGSITLTGGLNYYFEALQAYDENGINPHVEVAWQSLNPAISQEIIPNSYIFPYDPTVPETQGAAPAGTFYPEADAYVRGGGSPNSNYGLLSYLYASGPNASPGKNMNTFARYNLSSLTGTITKATLYMYVDSTVPGDSNLLEAAVQPAGDLWTENGVSSVNQPALNASATAGPWTPVAGQWMSQDVTALVQSEYATDPNKRFSFGIIHNSTGTTTGYTIYSSKEDIQANWPYLVVNSSSAPPVTMNNYTFASNSIASSDTDANSTASNFLNGTGYTNTGFGSNQILVNGPGVSGNTAAQNYAAGQYFYFTTTPVSGKTLHMNNFSITVSRRESSPNLCTVYALPTGGPASGQLQTLLSDVTFGGDTNTVFTADLSGADFQGLSSISFYILFDGANQGLSTAKDLVGPASATGAAY